MKPYNRKFTSHDEAAAYFNGIGKLKFSGRAGAMYEYCVYNLHLHDGRKFHVNIWDDGKVTYEEMSLVQYNYWRSQE